MHSPIASLQMHSSHFQGCWLTAHSQSPLPGHCLWLKKITSPKLLLLPAEKLYSMTGQYKDPLGAILMGHLRSRITCEISWGFYCDCMWYEPTFSLGSVLLSSLCHMDGSWEHSHTCLPTLTCQRNASPLLSG